MEVKPGYKQTEVGLIPEDWDVVLLDSVAKRASGHTPDKAHPEYWDGDIKWVSLADSQRLDNLYISETSAKITPKGIANSSANLLPAGSCIVTRDAGVGKSAILAEPMAVSQHFMSWHCGPRLDNHFLYFVLQRMKTELERIAIGNTIKTIGLPYFKNLRIQLPSLAEQNYIASALTEIDQLIRELELSIAKKRGIKQAAMQELLTGKRRLPGFEGEWEVKRLGELCSMKSGESITAKNIDAVSPFPCYGGNGQRGFTSRFTHEGDYCLIGRVGALCGNLLKVSGRFFASEHAVVVSAFEDVDVAWLTLALGTLNLNRRAESSAQPVLTVSKLDPLEINVPLTKQEQTAIAAVLSDMDAELVAIESRLDKTRALKHGMMHELLTGRTRLVKPANRREASVC